MYFPPTAKLLPPSAFEGLINAVPIRMSWLKNHSCPCVYSGSIPGSPVPQCATCHGRGVYWDNPVGPFSALITYIHTSPTPDEPGAIVDETQGLIYNGEPTLTIGYTGNETIWTESTQYDMFVEVDAISRFSSTLFVSGQTAVPYQQALTIPATGAVTVWNSTTSGIVSGIAYTVSGSVVTLNSSGYGPGTSYTVEYKASPAFVAHRIAGSLAHIRPFGQLQEPRRYRLQQLDLWTRATSPGDIPQVP